VAKVRGYRMSNRFEPIRIGTIDEKAAVWKKLCFATGAEAKPYAVTEGFAWRTS
jgi:hypothetical protein